jgi:hypothetical protein
MNHTALRSRGFAGDRSRPVDRGLLETISERPVEVHSARRPIPLNSAPSAVPGDGIRSCDVIATPRALDAFCTEHWLVCDPVDPSFFNEWAMIAVVVD